MATNFSCARNSHDLNESFLGTASPFRYALVIEYHDEFPESAIIGSSLSEDLKRHILRLYEIHAAVRILLMKQSDKQKKKRLFWADCQPGENKLWYYEFEDYKDLLALKLGETSSEWIEITEEQFFICTNGQHDPCCGKYGNDLYEVAADKKNVWQTTHLGGDRFAANVLALPSGVYYRRVHIQALEEMIKCHSHNKIYLPNFAGRTVYDRPVQVAEYFIREKTHLLDLDALKFVEAASTGEIDSVKFAASELVYTLKLQRVEEQVQFPYSCHAKTPGPLTHYELLEFTTSKT